MSDENTTSFEFPEPLGGVPVPTHADDPQPDPGGPPLAADVDVEGVDFFELLGPDWDAPSPSREREWEPKPDVDLDDVLDDAAAEDNTSADNVDDGNRISAPEQLAAPTIATAYTCVSSVSELVKLVGDPVWLYE